MPGPALDHRLILLPLPRSCGHIFIKRDSTNVVAGRVQPGKIPGVSVATRIMGTLVLISLPPHPIGQQGDRSSDDRSQQRQQGRRPIHDGSVSGRCRTWFVDEI
jgi:hypothetical protein